MTDKIQKIREEVQRLQDLTMDKNKNFYSEAAEGEYNALCNIEHFIDSLQKEPVSEDLEKEFSRFLDEKEGMPRMRRSEEQLEWALDIACHIANWQKAQMMKDAVDANIGHYFSMSGSDSKGRVVFCEDSLDRFKVGDKVKVIIIEEGKA